MLSQYRAVAPTMPDTEKLQWDDQAPDADDDYVAQSQRAKARSGTKMAVLAILGAFVATSAVAAAMDGCDARVDISVPKIK